MWGLLHMTGILVRSREDRERQKENGHVKIETEIRVRSHKPRNSWGYQKLEEIRKSPPSEAQEGAWSEQQLDCRLLDSRIHFLLF